jgi:WD40 repeat protein
VAAGSDFATAPVFTRDGKTLITGHGDNAMRFWDVATGEVRHKIALDLKSLRQIVLSPDGKTVAAIAYQSETIHLIDVAGAKERSRIAAPDRADVTFGGKQRFTEIALTPDGKSIVAAGIDDSLILFDPATGKEQRRLEKGFDSVYCMAISPDGKTIATAVGGKTIRLTDLASGRDRVESAGHSFGIWSATFADGGKLVATVGGGKDVIVWDAATGRELRRLQGHTAGVTSVALLPDGRTLRSTGSDKTVRYWDPATGKPLRQADSVGNGWNQTRAPDGKILVEIDGKSRPNVSTLRLLDADTNKELGNQKSEHPWYGAVFSRNGKTLVGWTGDRMVHVLDPATGKRRTQYPIDAGGGGNTYYGVHLSNSGRVLACGSQHATLVIVETATGRTLHSMKGLPDGVSAVAFSPDDTMLAWGGWNDPRIHLIELATGKERHTLAGTSGRVLNLTFSPDGQRLLSGSEDTTATVWDLTGRFRDQNPTGPLNAADLDTLWMTLSEADAASAYRAVQRLAGSPKDAVPFLSQRIKPLPRVSEKELARYIADLDDEDFTTRERATEELDKLGEAALLAYDRAMAGNPSAESGKRLAALRSKYNPLRTPSNDRLRLMRALEALERCGPESRKLLTALADGAPGVYVTEQARGALQRHGAVAK